MTFFGVGPWLHFPINFTDASDFQGKAMEKIIPRWGPLKWFNPGPFNIKEHGCIIIMSSTVSYCALSLSVSIHTTDVILGRGVGHRDPGHLRAGTVLVRSLAANADSP
jgi:hypothetical protein